jgi:hypothetical protein
VFFAGFPSGVEKCFLLFHGATFPQPGVSVGHRLVEARGQRLTVQFVSPCFLLFEFCQGDFFLSDRKRWAFDTPRVGSESSRTFLSLFVLVLAMSLLNSRSKVSPSKKQAVKRGRVAVNRDKPDKWKEDIAKSVDLFNDWFIKFAPKAFRDTRIVTTKSVEAALGWTKNLTDLTPTVLRDHPDVLQMLRMATCPPIARDRLIGLSGASKGLVSYMEHHNSVPPKMSAAAFDGEAQKLIETIKKLTDPDIFVWLGRKEKAESVEVHRAATIVADRLCGSIADPIVRNAQEARQLSLITKWLEKRGYVPVEKNVKFSVMEAGTFGFRMNVSVKLESLDRPVNIPIDAVVMPKKAKKGDLPLLIEAKSAGDFTNVNKRRKEEATKMVQLRKEYGKDVRFILFLCGYFDTGYLGYEAAEGIDWVWEHRIDDLASFGI